MGETLSSTSEGQPPEMMAFPEPPRVQRDPRVTAMLATIHGPPTERGTERVHPVKLALEAGFVRLSHRRATPSTPPNSLATSGVEETDPEQVIDPRSKEPLLLPPDGDVSDTSPAVSEGAPKSPELQRLYTCGRCDRFFDRREAMHHHVEKAHRRYSAKCIECQIRWGSYR